MDKNVNSEGGIGSFSSFEYRLFIEALGPMLNEMATQGGGGGLIDQQVA